MESGRQQDTNSNVRAVAESLLVALPLDGRPIGNISLLRDLQLSESLFEAAKEYLLSQNRIRKTRGRGGAIGRIIGGGDSVRTDENVSVIGPVVQLQGDAAYVFDSLPHSGAPAGNFTIMRKLGWDEARYWKARDELLAQNLAVRGQGRGGSLRRVILNSDVGDEISSETLTVISRQPEQVIEAALYEPIAGVLEGAWAKDRGLTPLGVELTAQQGRRSTGGRWTRPDLVMVDLRKFQYVPGTVLDVTTFEVKTAEAIDVLAVYEALSHRSSATYSFVIFHVPKNKQEASKVALSSVRDAAVQHGIGVVVAMDPADYQTWDEIVSPQRHIPDPGAMNDFIETQLSDDLKKRINISVR